MKVSGRSAWRGNRGPSAHLDEDAVVDLVHGELTTEAERTARAHLADCRGCADLVAAQRDLVRSLQAAQPPKPTAALVAGLASMSRLPCISPTVPGEAPPDSARWVFAAMLAGGVSLTVLGAVNSSTSAFARSNVETMRTVQPAPIVHVGSRAGGAVLFPPTTSQLGVVTVTPSGAPLVATTAAVTHAPERVNEVRLTAEVLRRSRPVCPVAVWPAQEAQR